MKINEIVSMAVDRYNGRAVENYSKEDTKEALRLALIEANGGSTKIGKNFIRGGENKLYEIVEKVVTKAVLEGLPESNPLFRFIEWKTVENGDAAVFEIRDGGMFIVSDIAYGTQGLRRQRIAGGEEITVKTQLKGVKIYEELRRILAGRVDFNDLIDQVSDAFQKKIAEDSYNTIAAAFDGLVAPYSNGTAGTFDEGKMFDIISEVERATGKTAMIFGSMGAVRKMTGLRGSDSSSAKEALYAMGYYDHFYKNPVFVMQDGNKAGTHTPILKNDLYIVAGDDKFIKAVMEGEALMLPTRSEDNADLSQEYLMTMAYGMKAVLAADCMGIYKLA